MVNDNTVRNILGIVGNVTSFLLFLSPLSTIWTIWTNGSVGEFKYHTIVAGILNCIMWVFYSMPFVQPDSLLVTTINSVGLAMYFCYNIIFYMYADSRTRRAMWMYYAGEFIALVLIVCITMLLCHTLTIRSAVTGIFCDIFVVILYASPLSVMWEVIKTRSVEFMPLPLSLAGFANGVIWTLYACIKFDPYILIGNGLGAFLGLIQLVLYCCYCNSTPKDDTGPSEV